MQYNILDICDQSTRHAATDVYRSAKIFQLIDINTYD